jgi:hypothetical protein
VALVLGNIMAAVPEHMEGRTYFLIAAAHRVEHSMIAVYEISLPWSRPPRNQF